MVDLLRIYVHIKYNNTEQYNRNTLKKQEQRRKTIILNNTTKENTNKKNQTQKTQINVGLTHSPTKTWCISSTQYHIGGVG